MTPDTTPTATSLAPATLRNLGPQSMRWLKELGIGDVAQLRDRDPVEVYAALKARNPKVSLNMLYALIGAVEDMDWRDVQRTRRTALLMRLDDLGLAPKR